jgi:hypothetical protein
MEEEEEDINGAVHSYLHMQPTYMKIARIYFLGGIILTNVLFSLPGVDVVITIFCDF